MTTTLRPPVEDVAYSFGLPGGALCVPVVQHAVSALLGRHGLACMAGFAGWATGELLGAACQQGPDQRVSFYVRWRFGALRLTAFDQHAAGEASRRGRLVRLDAGVRVFGGTLAVAPAGPPLGGTRTWVSLPREGVRSGACV
ncbi:hypothetical protein [Streptomyces gobiensis]|uniref:hypothetical protein n=1 Tax=Streptomyces gobiensis TaxID=2875706 RepID=UPI001E3EBEE7|nr:hypothetical protein [Streptomyces gobiensis]UGY93541.1 hypothetical protein test1122_18655 [Streptomyces gobiensis]